jgi:RecJ-like exonuclease
VENAAEVCVACEGSGKNSKGNPCRICDGTGLKPTEKEEKKESKEERILARKKKKAEKKEAEGEADNPCPYGHVFGADLEKFEHCSTECEKWDACLDAQEDSDN